MLTELQNIFPTCVSKQEKLIESFQDCKDAEAKYKKIMEMGRPYSKAKPNLIKNELLVPGCQSQMFLSIQIKEGLLSIDAYCEALISAGLAALMIHIYDSEPPQNALACPPYFIEKLNLHRSLSPSRSSGLQSILVRIRQDVIKLIHNNDK